MGMAVSRANRRSRPTDFLMPKATMVVMVFNWIMIFQEIFIFKFKLL